MTSELVECGREVRARADARCICRLSDRISRPAPRWELQGTPFRVQCCSLSAYHLDEKHLAPWSLAVARCPGPNRIAV